MPRKVERDEKQCLTDTGKMKRLGPKGPLRKGE
jgi:hypothetical protein